MLHFDWNQDEKSFYFRILLPVLGSYKILSCTELYEDQARKQRQRQAALPVSFCTRPCNHSNLNNFSVSLDNNHIQK